MDSRVGGLVGGHEGELVSFDLSKDFMLKLKVVFEVDLRWNCRGDLRVD